MDVKLSDDNIKDIIAKAVLDTLTPESREQMITSAVKSFLTIPVGNQYEKKSPLQSAFDNAIREVAASIAREQIINNSEIHATISTMIADAWKKLVIPENYSKIVDNLSSAIERGLTGDRY